MDKQIKNLTPLLYALLVVLVFSLLGVFWYKVKTDYNIGFAKDAAIETTSGTDNATIPDSLKAISNNEHVRGNPQAKYAFIEYSDYDCPFCKTFHTTMQDLISENKDYKWVFRHFPLTQIHPNAGEKAKVAVCVNELGGSEAFWQFTDALYEDQTIEVAELNTVAAEFGVKEAELTKCLEDFDNDSFNSAFEEAQKIGINGTPATIIVNTDNGKAKLVVGAVDKQTLVSSIEELN